MNASVVCSVCENLYYWVIVSFKANTESSLNSSVINTLLFIMQEMLNIL